MDEIVKNNKDVLKKFVSFKSKENENNSSKIEITPMENFEFLITAIISKVQLAEIKKRYNI